MAWSIVASTATTLSVFFPLPFWRGTVGEFVKFPPLTVILTLAASLFMALVSIPVLGGLIGRRQPRSAAERAGLHAAELGDPRALPGVSGAYARTLERAVLHPGVTLAFAALGLALPFTAYARLGHGLSFLPEVEPEFAQVEVRARDNLSAREQDALVRRVEERLLALPEVRSVYARSGGSERGDAELIGTVQLEFVDWDERRTAEAIVADIRADVADVPGIDVQVRVQSNGPSQGKPVNLRIAAREREAMSAAVARVRERMEELRRVHRRDRHARAAGRRLGSSTWIAPRPRASAPTSRCWAKRCSCSRRASRSANTARTTPRARSTSACASRPTRGTSSGCSPCACRRPPGWCRSRTSSSSVPRRAPARSRASTGAAWSASRPTRRPDGWSANASRR